jgi:peptide/nickel transport system substrate-binding protein
MIDDSVKPWLAESWKFADDMMSITFNLRKGVKFHDGTDFNAEAVKWQIDMNKELKNVVASNWKSVDVIDPYTVRINFEVFKNTLWADLTDTRMFFVSPTQYKNNGNSVDYMREHPCGTGPFIFKSWERDVNMVFTRNASYWDTPKPYLDGIEFVTVKDKVTQQSVMQSGDGDVLALLTGRELSDMKASGFDTVAFAAGTDFMVPDTIKPNSILANKNLRLAMEYAIDKAAVTKALGYGYMVPNWQLPSPQQPYYMKDLPDKAYSIEKAKALMTEAGYPNGFNTKLYVEGAAYGDKALAIQAQLAKANINAEIVTLENLKFWEYNFNGWPDGVLFAGFSWSPNFARSFNSYFPPRGLFFHDVKVPEAITALADKAMLAKDAASQRQANYDLIKAVYDDQMIIPYLSDAMGWAVATYVKDHHLVLEGADFCSWFPADIWLDK